MHPGATKAILPGLRSSLCAKLRLQGHRDLSPGDDLEDAPFSAQVLYGKLFNTDVMYDTIIQRINEGGLGLMYEVMLETSGPEFCAALEVVLEVPSCFWLAGLRSIVAATMLQQAALV